MTFDEMDEALEDARRNIRIADQQAGRMIELVVGRLRLAHDRGNVSQYTLRLLKDELRAYNPHCDTWRD